MNNVYICTNNIKNTNKFDIVRYDKRNDLFISFYDVFIKKQITKKHFINLKDFLNLYCKKNKLDVKYLVKKEYRNMLMNLIYDKAEYSKLYHGFLEVLINKIKEEKYDL